jgi:ABC-2 type transport system permease protein
MLGAVNWFHLISLMVRRDLKVRYRESVLGYAWSMLNPLLSMAVLATIFSHVVRVDTKSYPLFVLSGIICWNLFSQGVSSGVHAIVNNAFILRKVAVPSWVFPTASLSSAALNAALALIPYVLISLWMKNPPGVGALQLPFVFVLFYLFAHGMVMMLASINVLYRDIGHVIDPVLQILFYGTPILYQISSMPEKLQLFMKFNPALHFVDSWRLALYENQWISIERWLLLSVLAVASVLLGRLVYQRMKGEFLYSI